MAIGEFRYGVGGMRTNQYQSHRYTVAVTTIWSGASYVYSKDAVKILSQKDAAANRKHKSGR